MCNTSWCRRCVVRVQPPGGRWRRWSGTRESYSPGWASSGTLREKLHKCEKGHQGTGDPLDLRTQLPFVKSQRPSALLSKTAGSAIGVGDIVLCKQIPLLG